MVRLVTTGLTDSAHLTLGHVTMTTLTLVGNLAADPEVRFTASGLAVANFTVCHTPQHRDKATGEWVDGETLFMRCSIWRDAAEHVAATLHRGDRVIVTGKIKSRSYTTAPTDGSAPEKRTVVELEAEDVGPSLKWATAKVVRADRASAPPSGVDPWSSAPTSSASPLSAAS